VVVVVEKRLEGEGSILAILVAEADPLLQIGIVDRVEQTTVLVWPMMLEAPSS